MIQVQDREKVRAHLSSGGIATGVHYPIPLHFQPAYARLKLEPGSFPVAEEQAQTILSLPMYPELTDEQTQLVVDRVKSSVVA